MTKILFKLKYLKLLTMLAGGIFCLMFFLPSKTSAAWFVNKLPKQDEKKNNFCQSFNPKALGLNARLETKAAEISAAKDQKYLLLKTNREKRQEKLDSLRLSAKQNLDTRLNDLTNLAKTAEQKQAVEKFKILVNTAASQRNQAIDQALKTFQTGLDNAIKDLQNQAQSELNDYENSVKSALEQAKNSCGKLDAEDVKKDFTSHMQAAKEKISTRKEMLNQIEGQLELLKNSREEAVSKANQDFKEAVNTAAVKLKTSF